MEGTGIIFRVILKIMSNLVHLIDDSASSVGEARGSGRWHEAPSRAHEEFSLQFVGQAVEL